MPLLQFDRVSLRFARRRQAPRTQGVLCDVSLTVERGESVVLWGTRRSGRTTFLQVAAGMRSPTAGKVVFANIDLARRSMLGLPGGIAYATAQFDPTLARSVIEHVGMPLVGGRCSREDAHARARKALRRVDAEGLGLLVPIDLDEAERSRVALARGLVTQPALLLLDEPTNGLPAARERDAMLSLIDSVAHDDRVAVLMTTGDAADLAGADRAVTLGGGRLRGDTASGRPSVSRLRSVASSGRRPAEAGSSGEATPR